MTSKSGIIASILAFALILSCLSGCDFVRSFAGRPTSSDLAVLREMRDAEIARQKAEADSLEQLRQLALRLERDSLEAVKKLAASGVAILSPSDLPLLDTDTLKYRYYISIGSYRMKYNVDALFKRIDAKYAPVSIRMANGLEVVFISPTNRIADIPQALEQALKEPYCPKDAWILDTGERKNKE